VPKSAPAEAERRNLFYLDAERHHAAGREIVLIGHAGHPEVEGTLGQLPEGVITLIETVADARAYAPRDPDNLAFVTQTTLSVDDTAEIVAVLKSRFPAMSAPHREDICYATTNRQEAVKRLAGECDLVLVVGSKKSSNSQRLVEVALRAGARDARLIDDAGALEPAWLAGVRTLGLTAGASAPEVLVEGVLDALAERFDITVREADGPREDIAFKLPRVLAEPEPEPSR
jgi:4-hydroxy-3-methylbut-2-enyl diphosphate reductase